MADANMIQCPNCGQAYFVQPHQWAQYTGQTINCTRCGRAFAVTSPGAASGEAGMRGPGDAGTETPPQAFAPPPFQGQGFPGRGFASPGFAPPYPQYAGGMYPTAPARTSGWAVSSLVLGVLSFCLPVLGSIAAIATGIGGLVSTRERRMGGRALAVAGLALGLFTLVIETPLMVMVSLPAATRAREQQHRVQCADNVKAMGAALIAYAETHGNSYPAQLDDVTELSPPPPAGVFVCPSDRKTPPASAPPESMAADINSGEHCSYVYVGTGVKTSADPRVVILYEPLGNHNREGMNVLFADGQCKWLNADEAQSILDQRAKGKRPIRVE